MRPFDIAWQVLKEEVGTSKVEGNPHITWMSPEKRMAWVDGHGPYTANSIYAALKEQGTYDDRSESISGQEEAPVPTEQEQFQQTMFDEEGSLR